MIRISKAAAVFGLVGYLSLLGSCFLADRQIDQLKAKLKEDEEIIRQLRENIELINRIKSAVKQLEQTTKEQP